MSLYGMMRTGVSGMNAQANRLSTVADNIANSGTTGYKRSSHRILLADHSLDHRQLHVGRRHHHDPHLHLAAGRPQIHHLRQRSRHQRRRLLRRAEFERHALPHPRRLLRA